MKRTHRKHSAEFKTKVALEAIKEQKTLSQICEQYSLHATQISDWKSIVIENAASLFDKAGAGEKKKEPQIVDLEALHAPYLEQIGQLQMEVSFLKKKLKQLGQT